ncbi:MAG: carbohydrate ABC transporter permease [Candidatus Onthovivens sp.]|nr:carbohydrate ABC transporter permease [Candidatus Onthovivens sp.]
MNKNAKKYLVKSNGLSRSTKRNIGKSILTILGFALGFVLVIPFVWMILCSFQENTSAIYSVPPVLPSFANFNNFAYIFNNTDFWNQLKNTLILTISNMAIGISSTILTAYGFSRFRCKGKGVLFTILLSTMMLPWVVTMVPAYIIFSKLNLISVGGGMLPLILPSIGGSAYNVFLLKQFFASIPKELDEAAKIDGCSTFKILWKILLPNMLPILGTIFIFSFIGCWADYIGPSIYITDTSYYTLSLGLQLLKSDMSFEGQKIEIIMAGALIYSIPMIIIYITCQKAYVRGAVGSAIKG